MYCWLWIILTSRSHTHNENRTNGEEKKLCNKFWDKIERCKEEISTFEMNGGSNYWKTFIFFLTLCFYDFREKFILIFINGSSSNASLKFRSPSIGTKSISKCYWIFRRSLLNLFTTIINVILQAAIGDEKIDFSRQIHCLN